MDIHDEEGAFNDAAGPSGSTHVREEDNSTSTGVTGPATGQEGMSKNAMKKAARLARQQAARPAKRLEEKARRRDRAHQLVEGHAAGTLSVEDEAIYQKRRDAKHVRKAVKKRGDATVEWGGGVVLDLGFDELMLEGEITSMVSQIGYVYSVNRLSPKPFRTILHTSFSPEASPRLWEKMSKGTWDKWTRSWWWGQGVGELAKAMEGAKSASAASPLEAKSSKATEEDEGARAGAEKVDEEDMTEPSGAVSRELEDKDVAGNTTVSGVAGPSSAPSNTTPSETDTNANTRPELTTFLTGPNLPSTITPAHKLVYLSADAEEELTTLAEDEIYVIGGIVDRNRYKFLCENKAQNLNIRTARLPIGTYLANLQTRHVLTVNQVFQILVEYVNRQSWAEAFEAVIPARKFQPGRKRRKGNGGEENAEGAENEDGETEGEDGQAEGGQVLEGQGSTQGAGGVDEEDMIASGLLEDKSPQTAA